MTVQSPPQTFIKNGLHIMVSFLMALSAMALAFVMTPSASIWEAMLAVGIAGVTVYLWGRSSDFLPSLKDCPLLLAVIAMLLAWRLLLAAVAMIPQLDSYAVLRSLPLVWTSIIYGLAGLFIVLAVLWLLRWLWQGWRTYWSTIDVFEIVFFGILASLLAVLIYMVYQVTDGYWASMDTIFSIDSHWVSERILADPTYADLRHPVYAFLCWPLQVWFSDVAAFTPAPNHTLHVLWGILEAWMLLAVALLLYRLSGRQRHVAIIYVTTMPVWLFCFFIEKYQLSTLLALVTVAALAEACHERAIRWSIAATGCMTSTAPLLLACLLTRSPRQFIKRAWSLLCTGLGLLAVSGRLDVLLHLQDYWQKVDQFTSVGLTLQERIYCYINGVTACLFPLSHELYKGQLIWRHVGAELRPVGAVILVIAVIGLLFRFRERSYRLFFCWLLFQPLFFIVFGWSPSESPLFALYFSWAMIPLFCSGLQGILGRFPRLFALVVTLLCSLIVLMNVPQWLTIFSMLRQLYPVA